MHASRIERNRESGLINRTCTLHLIDPRYIYYGDTKVFVARGGVCRSLIQNVMHIKRVVNRLRPLHHIQCCNMQICTLACGELIFVIIITEIRSRLQVERSIYIRFSGTNAHAVLIAVLIYRCFQQREINEAYYCYCLPLNLTLYICTARSRINLQSASFLYN